MALSPRNSLSAPFKLQAGSSTHSLSPLLVACSPPGKTGPSDWQGPVHPDSYQELEVLLGEEGPDAGGDRH